MEKKRYLLKGAHHLMHIEALLDVLPDASFIFTSRKLSQVIPSFCAFISLLNEQFGGQSMKNGRKGRYFPCHEEGYSILKCLFIL